MTTLLDMNVALEYSRKGFSKVGTVFQISFDGASRAANVVGVSISLRKRAALSSLHLPYL